MNRLSNETSPYLLQHAANPVDWYPWGEAALNQAREENKPILLSVGYSACHWCHVMAHESFEDPATAEVMNRLFVNIKVDREERPDIDKIYQTAHQLITRRGGGWPLTVFLTPDDQRPFFAGTYFPAEARHGMPAFTDLLAQIAQYFATHRDEIARQADAVVAALASLEAGPDSPDALDDEPLEGLRAQLAANFDGDNGGFGGAPKFPHTSSLEYLLRHWRASAHSDEPDVHALYMTALTVTRMIEGGLYDQLGGGFFRYSVDAAWQIPHFEKMLYDNGPLLGLLAQLWQASGDDTFRRAAMATADWALREMHDPNGGFYAALDADSEGEEGRYYVWQRDQVEALLDAQEMAAFGTRFGLNRPANFEGAWHLQVTNSIEDAAAAVDEITSTAGALIDQARARLFGARELRVRPGRDEKILTAWNALMIRGLSLAGRALDRPDLVDTAAGSLDFIMTRLQPDGRLLACYKDGRARFPAYLDDHAYLLDATLELLQARWSGTWLDVATGLADTLLERFADPDRGGFFFTASDHEELVHRSRTFSDDSLPNGNAVAALALNRLGHLLGESRYLQAAEGTLQAGMAAMRDFPHGHAALITALAEYRAEPEIVIVRGAAAEAADWARTVGALYAPQRLVFAIPADATDLPGALALREAGKTTLAYVCRGARCSLPLDSRDALVAAIREA